MTSRSRIAVGCYTHETAIGIRVVDFGQGPAREHARVTGVAHASFLARHPRLPVLYAVSETVESSDGVAGSVVALRFDAQWKHPVEIGRVPSGGDAPCHLDIDPGANRLYVANYVTGTIAAYGLGADGAIGACVARHQHEGTGPLDRQRGPHAHCVRVDPKRSQVHAVDLGADRIFTYYPDPASGLRLERSWAAPAGTGPRHLALHPSAPVAFVVGELDSTITMLRRDATTGAFVSAGVWTTLPAQWCEASTTAEVAVHPSGHTVYVSNRGHDSLAVFGFVDEHVGLVPQGWVATGGAEPRHFALNHDGSMLVVANQGSNALVCMTVDQASGQPSIVDRIDDVTAPVCVRFLDESP